MAMSPVAFEVVRDIDRFRALQSDWNDLWHRAEGEYFQSFAFCHGVLEAEDAASRRKLHCIAGRREGRLVVVWPLMTFWRSCWKYATALTPANRSPSDILASPEADVEQIVNGAWKAALRSTRADAIELWRIRSNSPLCRNATRHGVIERGTEETTPYARLRDQGPWETFVRALPGRKKTRPEYLERRLARHGEMKFEIIDVNDSRVPSLVEWFVSRKREWAQHNLIDSRWTFSEASSKFWRSLLSNDSSGVGVFRLFVLTLAGEPVALNIVAAQATRAYLVANTYDLRYGKLTPGTVLVDYCVKWAFDNRLDMDFGPGDQQYKSFWSAGHSYLTSSFLVIPTRWGQAGYAAKQVAKQLRTVSSNIAGRRTPERNPVHSP